MKKRRRALRKGGAFSPAAERALTFSTTCC